MGSPRVLVGLAAGLALLLLMPGPVAGATGGHSELTVRRSAASYGQTAFTTSNNQRVRHDRSRLSKNDCLQRFAVKQAQRMANQTRMFHQELGPIQQACSVGWVGENVAMGYPSRWSVVVQGWMRSEGHRANILSRHYRLMAVAARKGDDGSWYASQVFGRKM
jgi:uncharacterized protein YkwD